MKQKSSAERTHQHAHTKSPLFQSRVETPVMDVEYGYHNQPANHYPMKNQYSQLTSATEPWHKVTNPRYHHHQQHQNQGYLSDCRCQSSTGCQTHDFQPIKKVQNQPENLHHNNIHQTKESNVNLQHKNSRYQSLHQRTDRYRSNLSSVGPHAEDRFYQRGPMNIQTDPYCQTNSQHNSMSANVHSEDCDTCQSFQCGGNFGSSSYNHSHYGK